MSSAGISFGGLASGLDTQAIISALVAVEQRPIFQLEQKKSTLSKQKSLFGDLDGLLDTLTNKAKALKTTSGFLQMTASSDDESVVTASASSTATPGTYSVAVKSLATAQVNTAGQASPSATIQSGTASLQIDVGGSSYFVSVQDPSLDSIAAAINAENEANEIGVRAEVIDTGNTTDPSQRYQLVVRAEETGVDGAFSVSVDDGNAAFTALIDELSTTQTVAASNAELVVNGVTLQRSSNTISDLFAGITLEVKSVSEELSPGPPPTYAQTSVTVATDGEETSTKVKEFVDAYNAVVDFMLEQNKVDEEGTASGPLFGDTTLRSIRSSLRGIVGGSVNTTGNEAFQLLSQIGIKADTQGKLTFTQSEFEEALAEDEDAVTALFTDTTNGIAARLETQIDLYTDSVDGLLKTRSDGYDRRIKDTNNRIDAAERRLELYEQQLTVKYANLETLLTRLQGQGSSIGNISQAFGG